MGEPQQKNAEEEMTEAKRELALLEAQRAHDRDVQQLEVLNDKFAEERKRFLHLYQMQNKPALNDN